MRNKEIKKSTTKVVLTVGDQTFVKHEENEMLDTLVTTDNPAKITVSVDLSNKQYGNGVAVMCSLSLNVDQEENAVAHAFAIASTIAAEEGHAALANAQVMYDKAK
tara:strand:+ start:157 stop:474 length:318 start_codon:yes stop_codon:yes gene_type:complete